MGLVNSREFCVSAKALTLLIQEFKNFLRKLHGEQMAAPLTTLQVPGDESAVDAIEQPGNHPSESVEYVNEKEEKRQKIGCGGPGLMCCCPCGALKGSADGESKKRMEKVRCAKAVFIAIAYK